LLIYQESLVFLFTASRIANNSSYVKIVTVS